MVLWCLAVVSEAAATTVWTFVLRLLPCHGDACSIIFVKLVRWSLGEVGGCCCGRRSAGEGSGFFRRDVLAWPDPGWMELGVSPRLLVVLRQDPSPRRWWLLRLVFAFGHGAHPAPRVCHLGAVLLHRLYRRWRTLVSGGNKEDDGSTAIASVSSLFFSSCICNRTCTVFLLG
jgi:hypothetical protein